MPAARTGQAPTGVAPPETPSTADLGSPQRVLEYLAWRFAGRQRVMVTGFGMEGCALMDMLSRVCETAGETHRVLYVDTSFFFKETYELRDRLAERYPLLKFERLATEMTSERQAAEIGPELWKSDPDRCCDIRKVRPLRAALAGVDVWITAIRRKQSSTRAAAKHVEWDETNGVIKANPLAEWDRSDVWDYIKANDVPYNPLHEQGYPSIGCTHCTVRVEGSTPDQYTRAGRWQGTNKTECGLHLGENI